MKRFSSCQEKMSIERSSLKSFSVVLTSLWPEWLTCLILEHIGLFFCVVFLAQFVPTIGSLSPTCNTKNQYNRIFIQKCLSGTPSHTSPGISWQTRLLDKNQKPQLLSSVGKREVQALPCSYKSDPRATWCPSQCCLGHRCISHCWRPSVAQTPWRFLLGKDFQLRSKGSLNILIFHYSFFFMTVHFCFSCKDTEMERCGDGSHWLQTAETQLSVAMCGITMAANPSLLLVCRYCICSLQSLSFQEGSE